MIRTCVVMSVIAVLSVPAAATTDPLAGSLRRCATETDEARRLACFDSLVATLPKIEADQFGLTRDLALKRDPVAEKQADNAVLPGTIVALGETPRGQLVFTLDNHQVWIQTDVQQSKTFLVGDVVHIEHGAMGTLWLAADHSRKTRVKRIS
jgi:hypothetical protein